MLHRRVWRNFQLGLAGLALLVSAGGSLADERSVVAAAEVRLVVAQVADGLRPAAAGVSEWVGQRLAGAGLSMAWPFWDGSSGAAGHPAQLKTILAESTRAGVARTLVLDLRRASEQIRVELRLYDSSTAVLRAAGIGTSSARALGSACEGALANVVRGLGVSLAAVGATPDSGTLVRLGRARGLLDADDLAASWLEIEGQEDRPSQRLRAEIEDRAGRSATPAPARAQLFAARGDAHFAWSLISRQATAALVAADPDLGMLLAAGDVQARRGHLDQARRFYERALEIEPRSAPAALGLGVVRQLQGDAPAARRALESAARLDPSSPRPLEVLAELESANTSQRARLYLDAGQRAARRLDVERAHGHFERAAGLDASVAVLARASAAELHASEGRPRAARGEFRAAIDAGGESGVLLRGIARAQRLMGETREAEASYLRALELDTSDADALRELGELYTAERRGAEAVVSLERALALTPTRPETQRALALALEVRSEPDDAGRALDLLTDAARRRPPQVDDLRTVARLERSAGDLDAARVTLEQALARSPLDRDVVRELAGIHEQRGDGSAARRAGDFERFLADVEFREVEDFGEEEASTTDDLGRAAALVESFVGPDDELGEVALLGVRQVVSTRERVLRWLHPLSLDVRWFERDLEAAIRRHHTLVPMPELRDSARANVARLFRFDSRDSLDSLAVSDLNLALGTDAVFVAQVIRRAEGDDTATCGPDPHFELRLRRLAGTEDHEVEVLGNEACLAGDLWSHGIWNPRAAGLYGVLLVLVLWPLVRGWGSVEVNFKLPVGTEALFAVSLSRRARKLKDGSARRRGAASWVFEKRLKALNRYEQRLQGKSASFRWIPARSREYRLTVRGPHVDYATKQLIGDFLEEKMVRVRRGTAQKIEFDLCPKECAMAVSVVERGQPVRQARIALRGDPRSVRIAADGSGFLYAGLGRYWIVAGGNGRVVEREVEIEALDARSISIDLAEESAEVFRDCPDAVVPYLESDFAGAAELLDRNGAGPVVHRVRALGLRLGGDPAAAARELEAAGDDLEAARLYADRSEDAKAAELFERASQYAEAAECYRRLGDLEAAARNYETAYDYENAMDCYRTLGDSERVIGLYEKEGDYVGAGEAALEAEQVDRAIKNFQLVDSRDARYAEACRMLADLLADRGDVQLAVEKLREAAERTGNSDAPLELLERLAQLLERAERPEQALEVYEWIRGRDLEYGDASARVDALRGEIAAAETELAKVSTPSEDDRYETLGELGRGGMGVVYRARDTRLGRIVALKVLPENLREHPAALELFEREARAAAALNDANIVTVHDAGRRADGTAFITMECLDGVGLDAVLEKRGALSPNIVVRLGIQVASGLHYAHARRIVHRDIKPSNLFLTRERVIKIMDFGLAKMLEEVRRSATVIGGTPNYMSPEQAVGEGVDTRSDLYSLGATLFHLLTGNVPFQGGDAAYHHRHTPAPDPRERAAEIPAPLAELIMQLMAKRPEDRVQTAQEVAVRLKASLKPASSSG